MRVYFYVHNIVIYQYQFNQSLIYLSPQCPCMYFTKKFDESMKDY